MADETKVTVEVTEETVKAVVEETKTEAVTEETKAEVAAEEVKEAKPKKEKAPKVKKEKKPRKPFFFDTAVSPQGLFGRCALIFIHACAIAYLLLLLFGALEMLVNNNPQTFRFVYPFTTAAMHGFIAAGLAIAYGIARIVCVIVAYNKKGRKEVKVSVKK